MADSLYAQYVKEREGKHILENGLGFATYNFIKDICYIEDIYTIPEARGLRTAANFADQITSHAKEAGCKRLMGSVAIRANNSDVSMKVLLAYGFKIDSCDGALQMIYLMKDIEAKNG